MLFCLFRILFSPFFLLVSFETCWTQGGEDYLDQLLLLLFSRPTERRLGGKNQLLEKQILCFFRNIACASIFLPSWEKYSMIKDASGKWLRLKQLLVKPFTCWVLAAWLWHWNSRPWVQIPALDEFNTSLTLIGHSRILAKHPCSPFHFHLQAYFSQTLLAALVINLWYPVMKGSEFKSQR